MRTIGIAVLLVAFLPGCAVFTEPPRATASPWAQPSATQQQRDTDATACYYTVIADNKMTMEEFWISAGSFAAGGFLGLAIAGTAMNPSPEQLRAAMRQHQNAMELCMANRGYTFRPLAQQ